MTRPARLREAHAHVGQLGRAMAMVDLTDARTVDQVVERLRARADAGPDPEWIVGHGLRVEALDEARWPDATDLDRATPRPCVARSFDHHAAVANTEALRRAGITPGEPDPPGGLIERTPRGAPTGVLYESAARRVWTAIPAPTPDEHAAHARDGLAALRALGFDEVHDLLAGADLVDALARLDAAGELEELGVTVVVYVPLEQLDVVLATDAGRLLRRRASMGASGRLRLGGVKIFADGTLNGRTARTLAPYEQAHDAHPTGMALHTPDELRSIVRRCDDLGLPLAAHAIGDGAVRAVLDAIEDVAPTTRGFRIEHAEIVDESDVPRFAHLGVVCSPQPCHLLVDVEALTRYLPHRLDRVLPLRELIDAGCTPGELLLFGSDVPIVRADPEDSILAATARRRADAPPGDAIAPAQAISEAEAWACFAPTQ